MSIQITARSLADTQQADITSGEAIQPRELSGLPEKSSPAFALFAALSAVAAPKLQQSREAAFRRGSRHPFSAKKRTHMDPDISLRLLMQTSRP